MTLTYSPGKEPLFILCIQHWIVLVTWVHLSPLIALWISYSSEALPPLLLLSVVPYVSPGHIWTLGYPYQTCFRKHSSTPLLVPRIWTQQALVNTMQHCSHEIKRCLLLGRKFMTNLDSIFKSKDITLPTKVRLVKAMVFPVVMYGCESWTVKKAEHQRTDAFELQCWRRPLRVPWTLRSSNQSILK